MGLVASMASPRRVSWVLYYSVAGAARRRCGGSPSQNLHTIARMTALGAVEAVCYQLARAAGEVDNLGLSPPKVERKDA